MISISYYEDGVNPIIDQKRKKVSPLEFREFSQKIDREWQMYLGPIGTAIVRMVMDRTVGWQKDIERISLRQFAEGVWQVKDGKRVCIHGGLRIAVGTLKRWLLKLEEVGVVRKIKDPDGGADFFSINKEWTPCPLPGDQEPKQIMGLRKPKQGSSNRAGGRLKKSQSRVVQNELPPSSERATPQLRKSYKEVPKGTKEKKAKAKTSPPSGGEQTIDEVLGEVQERSAIKAKNRREESWERAPSQVKILRLFNEAIQSSFPNELPLPGKVGGLLKGQGKLFVSREQGDWNDFKEFLLWVVENWSRFKTDFWGRLENVPDIPVPQFVFSSGILRLLLHTKDDWAFYQSIEGLDPQARELHTYARQKGVSLEKAEEVLGKTHTEERKAVVQQVLREERKKAAMSNQGQSTGKRRGPGQGVWK